jgi:hypothetical protein
MPWPNPDHDRFVDLQRQIERVDLTEMQIHAHVRDVVGLGLVVIFFVVFKSRPDKIAEDFFGPGMFLL